MRCAVAVYLPAWLFQWMTGSFVCGALLQGRALDILVIGISAATLVATFVLASWLPSRRAAQLHPARALRRSKKATAARRSPKIRHK
jgi:hypothetical protein